MFKCEHHQKVVVWTTIAADGEPLQGGKQLRHQCVDCGKLLANHLPHRLATPSTPSVDVAALKRFNDGYKREWQERENAYRAKRQAEDDQWLAAHDEYLQTDEWREKREAVMKRAGGLCEGCRAAAAVQVHHISYKHWRDELLFELVAVCRDCHERAHREQQRLVDK